MIEFKDLDAGKYADGLIPAIVQDAVSLKVLMLGFMNAEALKKTQEEGKVCFWSRSRNCLWTKGETSGNYLYVKDVFMDCDSDTILITANPSGPTCHRGTPSCFDTPENQGFIRSLSSLIKERHSKMPEGSYTTKLFIKGIKSIAKKFSEESGECVIEAVSGNKERFVYEASDVLYHYLVMLEQMGVSLDDIENELAARHR